MIRANLRMNKNESGKAFLRIQYYGAEGSYVTNEMLRVLYAIKGVINIEKESVTQSENFKKTSLSEVRSHVRRILNVSKANVIFTSTGRNYRAKIA